MFSLNATGAADLMLAFGYALALFLFLRAVGKGLAGGRAAGVVVVPVLAGLAIVLLLLVTNWHDSLKVFRLSVFGMKQPFSTGAVLVAVVAAVAAGDLALGRITPLVHAVIVFVTRQRAGGAAPRAWTVDVALALTLTVALSATVVLAEVIRPKSDLQVSDQTPGLQFTLEASYALPGQPQGMVFRGDTDGYMSIFQQGIMRFVLPSQPGEQLTLELAAGDMYDPRGLAILNNTLFIAHMERIVGVNVEVDPASPESAYLVPASPKGGSIIAFDILPDGSLHNRRTVVADLPVNSYYHAVHSIAAGPDGKLYIAVGGALFPNSYAAYPLLGTVVRFNPDGSELEVFARGIRNIYDLVFDDKGRLFGVDNDGSGARGYRREEVLLIQQGDHFGYPQEGTFDLPHRLRNAPPLWVLPDANSGSAGLEIASRVGVAPGLFIGGPKLIYLPMAEDEKGFYVHPSSKAPSVQLEPGDTLLDRQGYFTVVQAGPGHRLYAGVWTFSRTSYLYQLKFQ